MKPSGVIGQIPVMTAPVAAAAILGVVVCRIGKRLTRATVPGTALAGNLKNGARGNARRIGREAAQPSPSIEHVGAVELIGEAGADCSGQLKGAKTGQNGRVAYQLWSARSNERVLIVRVIDRFLLPPSSEEIPAAVDGVVEPNHAVIFVIRLSDIEVVSGAVTVNGAVVGELVAGARLVRQGHEIPIRLDCRRNSDCAWVARRTRAAVRVARDVDAVDRLGGWAEVVEDRRAGRVRKNQDAGASAGRGNIGSNVCALAETTAFIVAVEEELILDYRSAEGEAEAVVHRARPRQPEAVVRPRVGVKGAALIVLIRRAVQFVGSALGDDGDLAALAAIQAGGGVGGDNAKFLSGFDGDLNERRGLGFARDGGVAVGSFHVAGGVATVHEEGGLVAGGAGNLPSHDVVSDHGGDGRLEAKKRADLALNGGEAQHGGAGNGGADGGVGGLQFGARGGGDFDGLRGGADLKGDIVSISVRDGDNDAGDDMGLEAVRGDLHGVRAGLDRGEEIMAGRIGDGIADGVGSRLRESDFGTRNNGVRRVNDGAGNRAGRGALCKDESGREREETKERGEQRSERNQRHTARILGGNKHFGQPPHSHFSNFAFTPECNTPTDGLS